MAEKQDSPQEQPRNDAVPNDALSVEDLDEVVGGSDPEPFPYHDNTDSAVHGGWNVKTNKPA